MRAVHRLDVRLYALLAMLTLIAMPNIHADEGWRITQFEVFAGAPYQRADGVMEEIGFDWAEAEDWFPHFDKYAVEAALNKAAEWYSKEGFPEPVIEPIVNTDKGKAYRVYICTEAEGSSLWVNALREEFNNFVGNQEGLLSHWSNCGRYKTPPVVSDSIDEWYGLAPPKSSWAEYSGPCAWSKGARPVMSINLEGPAFDNYMLTTQGYATLAHELFHAIQANTVQGKSPNPCKRGKWITEGQADAISMDMMDELWATIPQPASDHWLTKNWGVRLYHENMAKLRTEGSNRQGGYTVSSFWAFLADLNRGYDYLLTDPEGTLGVFDFEIQPPPEEDDRWKFETMWLDQALSGKFDKRLNELFGLFMNDYSMRLPRYSWTSGHIDKDWPRWVNTVLGGWLPGGCQEIILRPLAPSQLYTLTIEPIAGACIWLTVENVSQATATVSLQTESTDVSIFKDILVGLPRGNTILTPAMNVGASPWDSSKFVGIWDNFTVPAKAPVLLTFTNMAEDPQKTQRRRDVIFEISLPNHRNNLRMSAIVGQEGLAEPALRPSYEKNTQSLAQKTAATHAMISEQKRLDKETLTPYISSSIGVTFHPDRPACRNPFKYSTCGPMMRISMNLMPGTWGNMYQSAGSGGPTSQIVSSLIGQSLASPFDHVEVMAELDRKREAIDASKVSITMPFVDYGFTGSFENAYIKAKVGGISMESIGPLDATRQSPLIGSVTIEAYTPFGIQGSFSAPLAYFESGPTPTQPKIYRRGPTMTGTFNQVAPWLSDSRVTRINLQTEQEKDDDIKSVIDNLTQSIFSSLEQADSASDDGATGGSAANGGNSSGGTNDCDCACVNRGKLEESCALFCEEEFAVCTD